VEIILVGYLKPSKEIDGVKYYDFSSPYGYSGPLSTQTVEKVDLQLFWEQLTKFNLDINVISEFVRFSLDNNHDGYNGKLHPTLLNVKGIVLSEDDQWALFNRKVRKNYNKAIREALQVKIGYMDISRLDIQRFYHVYEQTMKRTEAKKHFFYSLIEFEKLILNNPYNCAIVNVYYGEKVVSSELLLVDENSIYSYLGGTDDEYFEKRPNDFLKVEALNWARSIGKKYYVLGGGYGAEDGIFKYKKSFFPNDVIQFYTGRNINNIEIYTKLVFDVNSHRITSGLPELSMDDQSFFPLYNKRD
jgi:hypothetical protein